jgi:hypothetical protein
MPGTSRKSAWFSVQSRASCTSAHAAIAKSISRVRARFTVRYRWALTRACSVSNGIADFEGTSDSCAASSSDSRGPRSHSYKTKAGNRISSPSATASRIAGAESFAPVRPSMSTDVSITITCATRNASIFRRIAAPDESPSTRRRLPAGDGRGSTRSWCRRSPTASEFRFR